MARFKKQSGKPIEVTHSNRSTDDRPKKRDTSLVSLRDNDVRWYGDSEALIRDAASIPFAEPLGPDVEYGPNKRSVPGVGMIYYMGTVGPIGITSPGQAPINLAALRYFTELRQKNAGARNYDPNDLIQILLSVGSIYETIAFLKRVYSLLRDYQMTNRYYSRKLIESMNLDFDDLLKHISDLRYFINVCIKRASVYAIPKDMSFLSRRLWMANSIFLDAPMRKSQTYMYCPYMPYHYDWANATVEVFPWRSAAGDTCTTLPNDNSYDGIKIDFDVITTTMEALLSALAFNTDVGIITGDLIKAYGAENLFTMEELPVDYHVEPIFSMEVLTQIHNTVFALDNVAVEKGSIANFIGSFNIVQNGALVAYDHTNGNPAVTCRYCVSTHSSPKIGSTNYGNARDDLILLDMPIDPVSAEQVMVASRNICVRELLSSAADGTGNYQLINFGTEICLFMQLSSLVDSYIYSTYLCNDTAIPLNDLLKYTVPFSYLPRGYVFLKQTDVPSTGLTAWLFDELEIGTIDNYTIINSSVVSKMHQTAILSEFHVSETASHFLK